MIEDNGLVKIEALKKLKEYKGKNPYIKKLKKSYLNKKLKVLTENQCSYILRNYQKSPYEIDKIVKITEYLGESLKESLSLDFTPKAIYIQHMLDDHDKTYHVYCKLTTKQEKCQILFLPKNHVLDDPYFKEKNIDIDFEFYENKNIFSRKFFNHQKSGIRFLRTTPNAILADDMGLGKSAVTVVSTLDGGYKKVLLVCPQSVKINWQREFSFFGENDVKIVDGINWKTGKITIINYDILKNFIDIDKLKGIASDEEGFHQLYETDFDLIICDEAHNLKNKDSNRGLIMEKICLKKNNPHVWLLTGTPIVNRPKDFYQLLKLIKSPIANDYVYYMKRFCNAKKFTKYLDKKRTKKKIIYIANGASNLDELTIKTKNILLRRLKENVLDMPEKNVHLITQEMNPNSIIRYNNLWNEYLKKRKLEGKKGNIDRELVELTLLREFVAMENIPNTIELVNEIINSGKKVVIFTTRKKEMSELENFFGKLCVTHHGSLSDKEKQESVDLFQNDQSIKVFIGNVISAGVGITLTESNYVIFNSFDWVPGINDQCEDRVYRIGQKNNVTIYYQVFKNTISERMWGVIKNKQEVIDKILNQTTKPYEIIEKIIDVIENETQK